MWEENNMNLKLDSYESFDQATANIINLPDLQTILLVFAWTCNKKYNRYVLYNEWFYGYCKNLRTIVSIGIPIVQYIRTELGKHWADKKYDIESVITKTGFSKEESLQYIEMLSRFY